MILKVNNFRCANPKVSQGYQTALYSPPARFVIAKHESMLIEIHHGRDNKGREGRPSPPIRHSTASVDHIVNLYRLCGPFNVSTPILLTASYD